MKPVVLVFIFLLGGCATGPDRLVLDHPSAALDRSNGQPRWLPCMGGDALCTPRP